MFRHTGMVLALGSIFALGSAMPPAWAHGTTERVSVSSGGAQGNWDSEDPAISADGRFVAFYSYSTSLVPGDTNDMYDIFVHDRQTGTTERVSVSSGGAQGNGDSGGEAISAGGRFVAFGSDASNLVPGDTNGVSDILVHDRQTGTTERVSISSDGAQGNEGIDLSNISSTISSGGRYVAFTLDASNLVPGDTNDVGDVFLHDRQTGKTRRVSVSSGGGQSDNYSCCGPAISANGRFVAFESEATNLVRGDTNSTDDIFVRILAP